VETAVRVPPSRPPVVPPSMADSRWLVRLAPRRDAGVRLVCLPPAGGSAATFTEVAAGVPAWIDVWAVQLPGRRERSGETPARRTGRLLPALAAELADDAALPLVLCGDSLGAVLAFELVRRMERQARLLPSRLLVSSARAPHVAGTPPEYSAMSDARFVAELVAFGIISEQVAGRPELLTAVLPTLRADFELGANYRYRPRPPLRCPIDAVTGTDDVHVPVHLAEAWAELTTGEFTHTLVPGGHDLLRRRPETLRDAAVRTCARAVA
jgi:surfactin synthase thioesterase subunit